MSTTPIIGHEDQIASLRADMEAGNVSHAYLFAGRRHVGKFTTAKWFARLLLTADAKDEADRARREHEIDRLIERDLLVIDQLWIEDVCEDFDILAKSSNIPQQDRAQREAKTDTIGIDDIRALQERLHEVSVGRYRCCLIREAGRLQPEAVNALLKILEEPPPGLVFLLTAETESALLPTLVSRCRVRYFFPLPAAALHPLVREAAPQDKQFLLRLAQGAPGVILQLSRNPDQLRAERQRYAQAVAFWNARTLAERLRLLEPVMTRSEEAEQYLLHLALAVREEGERMPLRQVSALQQLVTDLQTNASRPLLVQRFALAMS